jgi:hypothetical protein
MWPLECGDGETKRRADRVSQEPEIAGPTAKLLAAVLDDFRAELIRMLADGRLGKHLRKLLGEMRGERPDLRELLRYGMSRLPADRCRPDDAVAAFFIVVSELQESALDVRIFATKCVEYCESEALDGWSQSLPELEASYEALAQRLF